MMEVIFKERIGKTYVQGTVNKPEPVVFGYQPPLRVLSEQF